MKTKNIALFGATGLIGSLTLKILENSPDISHISVFTRRALPFATGSKTEVVITDLTSHESLAQSMQRSPMIDVVLCAIGSTIKKSKTKKAFYSIDHDMVLTIAQVAKQKGIEEFGFISSLGANTKSSVYYLQVKGETERDLKKIGFKNLFILRPSLLLGERAEKRFGEEILGKILPKIAAIFKGKFKKYYPSDAHKVAAFFAKKAITSDNGNKIYSSEDIDL